MRFCIAKKVFNMKSIAFDWSLAQSFLAVLDAGSLLGAAKKLGAQQPTLSRHVAELEAQLGGALFERTGRGVTPTAMALAIVDAAREMEHAASRVAQALAQREQSSVGTIRIAASEVAAAYLLPEIVTRMQQESPDIAVEIVASNQISNLLRREADIAIRMVRPTQSSLVARKLGEIPIVAAAHRDYLGTFGIPRRAEQLAQHRLIGYDRDTTIKRGFAALGFPITRERFVLRTDDHVTYGRLVSAGAGIGFVAHYNLKHLPGVRRILPALRIPPLPCWLAVHREIRGNAIVRYVYDFLARAIPEALSK
jgi:DNA-binding transcriptional LysR family regulator